MCFLKKVPNQHMLRSTGKGVVLAEPEVLGLSPENAAVYVGRAFPSIEAWPGSNPDYSDPKMDFGNQMGSPKKKKRRYPVDLKCCKELVFFKTKILLKATFNLILAINHLFRMSIFSLLCLFLSFFRPFLPKILTLVRKYN